MREVIRITSKKHKYKPYTWACKLAHNGKYNSNAMLYKVE